MRVAGVLVRVPHPSTVPMRYQLVPSHIRIVEISEAVSSYSDTVYEDEQTYHSHLITACAVVVGSQATPLRTQCPDAQASP